MRRIIASSRAPWDAMLTIRPRTFDASRHLGRRLDERATRRTAARSESASLSRAQARELELELRNAHARLDRLVADSASDDTSTDGGSLGAPATADTGVAAALLTRSEARRQALADAIGRIEAGTYGTCVRCRQPIPYARLLVMPEATRCMACGARS